MMSTTSTPASFTAAMQSENADEWKQAMDDEIQSLQENDTYDLVKLPEGKKTVGGRWVFNIQGWP